MFIQRVTMECMTCSIMRVWQSLIKYFWSLRGARMARIITLNIAHTSGRPKCRAQTFNYIPCVLELSHAACCNLIGVWKFLNGDKPDVHDSPDPLSLLE